MPYGPDRRGVRSALRQVLLGLAAVALTLGIGANADAAKKSYRYEDDPIRLGMKALEENRIDEARNYFNEAIANEHQVFRAHYGLAEILQAQAAYADAEPLYRQAMIEKNKETGSADFPEAHVGLGFTLLRLQRFAEAKQEFEQALKEKSNYWEAQYGVARVAIEEQKWDEAERMLSKGERKKGMKDREDLYRYGMARVQYAKNDLAAAEKNALAALAINPNDPDYGALVAEIYDKRGARTLAIDAYEKALATPGLHVTARIYRDLGVLYQKEGRYNDALARYKKAYETDSTYAPAVKDMADLYSLATRNEEAMNAYLAYSRLRPDDPAGFLGFADSALKVKRYLREALDAAQKAMSLDSTNVATRLTLARAAFQNRDRTRARELYASVSDSTLLKADDYVNLGQMQTDAKEYDLAEKNLEKAVAMDSTLADAYFGLGLLDLNQAKPDSAAIHFQKSVQLAPTNAGGHLNLGIALLQLKRGQEAIHSLREAVRLAPDYTPARAILGQALVGADSLEAAIVEYKIVREKDPKNGSALRGLGFCYLKQKKYGPAATVLKEAVDADASNADGWAMLGQAQALQGSMDTALASFQKALAINPNHASAKQGLDAVQKAKKSGAGGK